MIKNEEERLDVERVILEYYDELKHLFISLISRSENYPELTLTDYNRFIMNPYLIGTEIKSSRVDQFFLNSILDIDPMK